MSIRIGVTETTFLPTTGGEIAGCEREGHLYPHRHAPERAHMPYPFRPRLFLEKMDRHGVDYYGSPCDNVHKFFLVSE